MTAPRVEGYGSAPEPEVRTSSEVKFTFKDGKLAYVDLFNASAPEMRLASEWLIKVLGIPQAKFNEIWEAAAASNRIIPSNPSTPTPKGTP